MLDRIKTVLLTQYIGAIVIGLLLAHGVGSLLTAAVEPLTIYLTNISRRGYGMVGVSWEVLSVPQFVTAVLHFVIAYLLLRWLYLGQAASPELADEGQESEGR